MRNSQSEIFHNNFTSVHFTSNGPHLGGGWVGRTKRTWQTADRAKQTEFGPTLSHTRERDNSKKHTGAFQQLTLNFVEEEKRQLESDIRSWRTRLEQFDRDLEQEPQRVREFYEVRAKRIEPVGLIYLWPETN